MNSDHYFSIGSQHARLGKPCEDFATSGEIEQGDNKYSYAIVADGCSSSEMTDLGSRILSLNASNFLHDYLPLTKYLLDEELYGRHESLGDDFVTCSAENLSNFDCQCPALHATTITAISDGENHLINMYGDGCFLIDNFGTITIYEVDYENNAPYYYWYNYKFTDYSTYVDMVSDMKKTITKQVIDSETGELIDFQKQEHDFLSPNYFYFKDKGLKSITVASDGISSFDNDIKEVAKEICAFKNHAGGFVKRRVLKMLKDYGKKNIDHYDDLSVATIYFGENHVTNDSNN